MFIHGLKTAEARPIVESFPMAAARPLPMPPFCRPTSKATVEDGVPIWFNPFPWVQCSEYDSWAEVAQWAIKLYQAPTELAPSLRQKIEQWRTIEEPEFQVLAVLRLLQDEVRYLGIEFGPNSHRPSDPSKVFERRFGDCKDKTLLFCVILNNLGFEASPVLLNSSAWHTVGDWHPSPYAFDHVCSTVTSPCPLRVCRSIRCPARARH